MRAIALFLLLTVATILVFAKIRTSHHEYVRPIPKPLPWPTNFPEPKAAEPAPVIPARPPVEEPVPTPKPDVSSPLNTSIDILGGSDNGGVQVNWAGLSGTGLEASWLSDEGLSLGLRKSFLLDDSWQGFISGGVFLDDEEETSTTTTTEIIRRGRCHRTHRVTSVSTTTDTDETLRPYGQAGINYLIDKNFKIGLLYRHNFVGEESSVDQDAVMLSFGVSF